MKIPILALKFTANPFIQCAMLVQGLKGSYIIQSPWSPKNTRNMVAFKILNSVGSHVCLKCPLQLFLGPIAFLSFNEYVY